MVNYLLHHHAKQKMYFLLNDCEIEMVQKKDKDFSVNANPVFTSSLNHEIRTSLSGILGFTKLANDSDNIEAIKEYLKKIESSSKHLTNIFNNLFDYFYINSKNLDLNTASFSLLKLLDQIEKEFIEKAIVKKIDFKIIYDEGIPASIFADEARLYQVVICLLMNSLQLSSPNSTIILTITQTKNGDDYLNLNFIITDTGSGLNPKMQKELFKPYGRINDDYLSYHEFTGLSLSLCKSIIEIMGGNINIQSKVNHGTTYSFDVIVKIDKTIKPISLEDMRVLVTDDNLETRQYMKQVLYHFGIKCDLAANGMDAINMVNKALENCNPYHVVFLDWCMPGYDGIETAKQIHALTSKNANIIFMSALEWHEIEEECKKIGIYRFISKPLYPSAILSVLEKIIDNHNYDNYPTNKKRIPNLAGKKILLAEDFEINRMIINSLLKPTDAIIIEAANGLEAVNRYQENQDVDLILMDVRMPEMDGYQAVEKIRSLKNQKAKSIPIIAVTADSFKEDIKKCKEVGMNDHIGKPINEEEFYSKIEKYLK